MKPNIREKLETYASPKGIDLSVIMAWGSTEDMPEVEMPEISAETVYLEIKDKLSMLDSDEFLKLIHMFLMEKESILQ